MRWLFVFFALPLFAAYVGNPAAPAIMNTGFFSSHNPLVKGTTGYIADYISNKRYEADQKEEDFNPNDAFRKFGIHSQLASFSVILLERLEIFGTVGGSKQRLKSHEQSPTASILPDFSSTYQFSWSTGGKVVLIQWGQTYLSADFTYFAIPESPKSYFKFLNRLNLPLDLGKQKVSLTEWQTSLGLSSRFFFITPYGGVTYLQSKLHVESGPETGSINYRNKYKIGYFYGLTLSLTGRFHLNAERRIRDEFGYTFSTIAVF
jgi:hypothetical protein